MPLNGFRYDVPRVDAEFLKFPFKMGNGPPRTRRVICAWHVGITFVPIFEMEAQPVHSFKNIGTESRVDLDSAAASPANGCVGH